MLRFARSGDQPPRRPQGTNPAKYLRDSGLFAAVPPESPEPPTWNLPAASRVFLDRLVNLQLVPADAADAFLRHAANPLTTYPGPEALADALVQANLLTRYQADRVLAGTTHGLILGNYCVLERLGAGACSVVFLAEHLLMKRRVAVKVLPVDAECPPGVLERFYSEMRVLADLHHPNIVLAFDAGKLMPPHADMPTLLYLVMEHVSGGDLEQYVAEHGPAPIPDACDWIRQAACGLQEAHDRHLIHRDVKPSNLFLSDQGQVKVMDFGLARQFSSRLTDPNALLGTIDYMAPEQSLDPSGVSAEADLYGLGATLFYLLTGEPPYPRTRSVAESLRMLQSQPPRRLRELRPDAPAELERVLDRLLERDPRRRPRLPLAVMNLLLPFTSPAGTLSADGVPSWSEEGAETRGARPGPRNLLIVDDEPTCRVLARAVLEQHGYACAEVADAESALDLLQRQPVDLLILDVNLPGIDGYELCRRLRERPPAQRLKIIIVSCQGDQDALAESLPRGADDYIPKPYQLHQLVAKVQHALRLKEAQDRADLLTQQLLQTNRQLENSLTARGNDLRQTQDALLFAMAKMAEARDGETAGHLRRLQRYTRALAEGMAQAPAWASVVNANFLEELERCVPLHDIGKLGLPDAVLLKPGRLTAEERALVQSHTVLGDEILQALAREHGRMLHFLGMATAVVRHHHERWDGKGYPDRLAGENIPPAARLVAVADVYDALRRRRSHKQALGHAEAVGIILEKSPGYFDPGVLRVFAQSHADWERIFNENPM